MRLTSYFKNLIIALRDQGYSFSQVRENFLIEKCTTSLSAVKRFVGQRAFSEAFIILSKAQLTKQKAIFVN